MFFGDTIVNNKKLRKDEFLQTCYVGKLSNEYLFSEHPFIQTSLTEILIYQKNLKQNLFSLEIQNALFQN